MSVGCLDFISLIVVVDPVDGIFVVQRLVVPVEGRAGYCTDEIVEAQGQNLGGIAAEVQSIAPGVADRICIGRMLSLGLASRYLSAALSSSTSIYSY